jgi:hypothetical protein
MHVGLILRIQLEEELHALGEIKIILCDGDSGDKVGMFEGLPSDCVPGVTVGQDF